MIPGQFFWGMVVGEVLQGTFFIVALVVLKREGILNIEDNK
jgi:hypothetical protein